MTGWRLRIGWLALSSATLAAGPEIVQGPSADPECFTPWSADTQYFQWPAKEGPYRIALANGFIGNTWRIQMIQTAKAYAALPEVAGQARGVQGRLRPARMSPRRSRRWITSSTPATTRSSSTRRTRRPSRRSSSAPMPPASCWSRSTTSLDTDEAVNVNVDQKGLGELWGKWLVAHVPGDGRQGCSRCAALPGTSVDRDRRDEGIQEVLETLWRQGLGRASRSIAACGTTARRRRSTADAVAVARDTSTGSPSRAARPARCGP